MLPFTRTSCLLYFFLTLTIVLSPQIESVLLAQENEAKKVTISLKNGEKYTGYVLEKNDKYLVMRQESGAKIEIPNDQIDQITPFELKRFALSMPNSSSYYFANSAQMLEKGTLQYNNSYLIFNGLNYGLNDYITVGGGVEIFSTLASGVPAIGYFRLKVGSKVAKNLSLSTGVIIFSTSNFDGAVNLAFTNATYGSAEHHLTLGLGYNMADIGSGNGFAMNLSYLNRFRNKMAFISENWVLSSESEANIVSYGFRFFGEKFSFDASLLNNASIITAFPLGIPYLGFQVKLK